MSVFGLNFIPNVVFLFLYYYLYRFIYNNNKFWILNIDTLNSYIKTEMLEYFI